jgi:hypothetical protein
MAITDPRRFAAISRAPYAALPPEDNASLAADPALRFRYCELARRLMGLVHPAPFFFFLSFLQIRKRRIDN